MGHGSIAQVEGNSKACIFNTAELAVHSGNFVSNRSSEAAWDRYSLRSTCGRKATTINNRTPLAASGEQSAWENGLCLASASLQMGCGWFLCTGITEARPRRKYSQVPKAIFMQVRHLNIC